MWPVDFSFDIPGLYHCSGFFCLNVLKLILSHVHHEFSVRTLTFPSKRVGSACSCLSLSTPTPAPSSTALLWPLALTPHPQPPEPHICPGYEARDLGPQPPFPDRRRWLPQQSKAQLPTSCCPLWARGLGPAPQHGTHSRRGRGGTCAPQICVKDRAGHG